MNHSEESIFCEALDLPLGERSTFVGRRCAGNDSLRKRVERLLQAHESKDVFLDIVEEPASQNDVSFLEPGQTIGSYRLVKKLGEGGFGVVFLAEQQEPIQRDVAIKIIKPGIDSKAVAARFELERQALAVMDHPNIARVFDGGAIEGDQRPYFVMEMVQGGRSPSIARVMAYQLARYWNFLLPFAMPYTTHTKKELSIETLNHLM